MNGSSLITTSAVLNMVVSELSVSILKSLEAIERMLISWTFLAFLNKLLSHRNFRQIFVIKEANSIMNESKEAFRKHLADNYFYKKTPS